MTQIKIINTRFFSLLPYLVLFIGSFTYFGFFGDYITFYQEKSALFIFSPEFLFEHLHQPGGFLIYLGKFFSTFYYYPLSGAIIISATITLIVLLISKIIAAITGKSATVFPLVIGTVLFFLQTDYRFLLYNNIGLLLQLVLFYLTIKYLTFLRGWFPVLIIPLWYFLTGGFSWLFSLMISFNFAFAKDKKAWIKIIILWLLNILTLYISKEFLFFQTERTLLIFPFADLDIGSQSLIFLSVAAVLTILPVIIRIKIRFPHKINIPGFLGKLIITFLLIMVLITLGIIRFDIKTKQYFHIEKLFYQHKFDEVIAFNTLNPTTNSLTVFLNNVALCETGKLNDQLFHFLQSPDGNTLFLKWEMLGEVLKRGGYFYYTIGMANEAHRWAFENMVMLGHSPEGVKMLIKTDLINGNYDVASKYIRLLKKTLFYSKEAKAFEKLLFNDPALDADPELGQKRVNRLEYDFFSITDDPYINIERILSNDSLNKNAFQYKLAFLLLRKYYQGISNEIPKLRNFGFTSMPVHIEEAAVALSILNQGKVPLNLDIQVSDNTIRRWNQYLSVFQQYGTDLKRAEPALRRQFGNTFWYYVFYR
jgi:hypothetical protein